MTDDHMSSSPKMDINNQMTQESVSETALTCLTNSSDGPLEESNEISNQQDEPSAELMDTISQHEEPSEELLETSSQPDEPKVGDDQEDAEDPEGEEAEPEEEEEEEEEILVPDGAFWHIEACLDNRPANGLLVEIVHSPGKFWPATIESIFGPLIKIAWAALTKDKRCWIDQQIKKCYPLGHCSKELPDHSLEPPIDCLDLIDESAKQEYLGKAQGDEQNDAAKNFAYLNMAPYELLKIGDILEIEHEAKPGCIWFAKVLKNIGGRLKLRWITSLGDITSPVEPTPLSSPASSPCPSPLQEESLSQSQSSDKSELKKKDHRSGFWMFFCHPRVHVVGYGIRNECIYEYHEEEEASQSEPCKDDSELGQVIQECMKLYQAHDTQIKTKILESCQRGRPDMVKKSSLDAAKPDEKLLVFSFEHVRLFRASIKSKIEGSDQMEVSIDAITPNQNSKKLNTESEATSNQADALQAKLNPLHGRSFICPYDERVAMVPISWGEENGMIIDDGTGAKKSQGGPRRFAKKDEMISSDVKPAHIKLQHDSRVKDFDVNSKVEVVHPKDKDIVCEGLIIRCTPPFIWIEIGPETITVLPYNSTDLFPCGWCMRTGHPLVKLLPARLKKKGSSTPIEDDMPSQSLLERLPATLYGGQWCPRIWFNHKCYTGPFLSKSKICSLPKYVGPGPLVLVLQEMISKILQMAYVPNRTLNELSGKLQNEDFGDHQMIKFKAKYQNRTTRAEVMVIRNAEKVKDYCIAVCEHLKCCYNLVGLQPYEGDHCPAGCRVLTKTSKIIKKVIHNRETGKLSLVVRDNGSKKGNSGRSAKDQPKKTSSYDSKPIKSKPRDLEPIDEGSQDDSQSNAASSAQKTNGNYKSESEGSDDETEPTRNGKVSRREVDRNSREDYEKNIFNKSSMESKRPHDNGYLPHSKRHRTQYGSDGDENEEADEEFEEDGDFEENTNEPGELMLQKSKNPIWTNLPFSKAHLWSIHQVHQFLTGSDCKVFANVLREQEVDGAAFLLLDYDWLKNSLWTPFTTRFKLSDLQRLCDLIKKVKSCTCKNAVNYS